MTALSKKEEYNMSTKNRGFCITFNFPFVFLTSYCKLFLFVAKPPILHQTSPICEVNLVVCYCTIFFYAAAHNFRNQHKGMMSRGLPLVLCTVLKCTLLLKTQT